MIRAIATVWLLVALHACSGEQDTGDPNDRPSQAERTIAAVSRAAVTALGDRDFEGIATLVHPVDGVRLSPYGFVDLESDKVLSPDELVAAAADPTRYLWGHYDGTGEPISLTFSEYYQRFVFDADYATAEQTGYDTQIGSGNTINNIADVYPGAITVEYHFSGFDPDMQGMDWRSLRLVFSRYTGKWYLVGIVHDEWTI